MNRPGRVAATAGAPGFRPGPSSATRADLEARSELQLDVPFEGDVGGVVVQSEQDAESHLHLAAVLVAVAAEDLENLEESGETS